MLLFHNLWSNVFVSMFSNMTVVDVLMSFMTPARSLEPSSLWSSLSLHSFMTSTPWELWQILPCVACIRRKHCPVSLMSSLAVFR